MVGSADYGDPLIDGQVNGAAALRQPGSALKPFTYGLALERGFPSSYLLPDVRLHAPTGRGDFTPHNYDERFHGPVRLRTALGCSYNIPAVRVLEELGERALLDRLHRSGFSSLTREPEHYGLGLTLGNGEVTLLELCRAYAALAGGGIYRKEMSLQGQGTGDSARVFSPQVSYLLCSILSDRSAHSPAFGETSPLDLPFPCAAKTGTTKEYRDNWAIGFTRDYSVGVWVGNFDGRPMHGVSGVSGAGPLFRDIMLLLHRDRRPGAFERPAGIAAARVCPLSGDLATACCPGALSEWFLSTAVPAAPCRFHGPDGTVRLPADYRDWAAERMDPDQVSFTGTAGIAISYPGEGDVFRIDPARPGSSQAIALRASVPAGARDLEWVLNGRPLSREARPRWELAPGRHRLYLRCVCGGRTVRSRTVSFLVQG
jgi:penicillin-binding protein 1C